VSKVVPRFVGHPRRQADRQKEIQQEALPSVRVGSLTRTLIDSALLMAKTRSFAFPRSINYYQVELTIDFDVSKAAQTNVGCAKNSLIGGDKQVDIAQCVVKLTN
jgi:hypothetical protein